MGLFHSIGKAVKGLVKGGSKLVKSALNPKTLLSAGIGLVTGNWAPLLTAGLSVLGTEFAPTAKAVAAHRYMKLPTGTYGGSEFVSLPALKAHMAEVDALENSIDTYVNQALKKKELNIREKDLNWRMSRYDTFLKSLEKIIGWDSSDISKAVETGGDDSQGGFYGGGDFGWLNSGSGGKKEGSVFGWNWDMSPNNF